MPHKPASQSLKEALVDLTAARDQARLKLHLWSMDAQVKWKELETKVQSFQQAAETEAERITDDSAAKARDLARTVRKFVEQHL